MRIEKPITFIELFKNLETVRHYNRLAGIHQNIIVFFHDLADTYGKYFSNYNEFKHFIKEEYNDADAILKSTFILGETFSVEYFGESFEYVVDLDVE